jgi:hypothetical protein
MPHYLKAMQLCHGAIDFVDRTDGIFSFTLGHEGETRNASKWFDIGNAKNTISLPRDCSLRASAVMGFKCPDKGILAKPIFTVAPCISLT